MIDPICCVRDLSAALVSCWALEPSPFSASRSGGRDSWRLAFPLNSFGFLNIQTDDRRVASHRGAWTKLVDAMFVTGCRRRLPTASLTVCTGRRW